MEGTWFLAATWLALALAATLLAIWLGISTALSEIVVGTVAQLLVGQPTNSQAEGGPLVCSCFVFPPNKSGAG